MLLDPFLPSKELEKSINCILGLSYNYTLNLSHWKWLYFRLNFLFLLKRFCIRLQCLLVFQSTIFSFLFCLLSKLPILRSHYSLDNGRHNSRSIEIKSQLWEYFFTAVSNTLFPCWFSVAKYYVNDNTIQV